MRPNKFILTWLLNICFVISTFVSAQQQSTNNFDSISMYTESYRNWITQLDGAITFIDKWTEDDKIVVYDDVFDAYIPDLTKHKEVYLESLTAQNALAQENENAADDVLERNYPLDKALNASVDTLDAGYKLLNTSTARG